MNSANHSKGSVFRQVLDGSQEQVGTVAELPQPVITLITKKAAHAVWSTAFGFMAVVNHEDRIGIVTYSTGRIATDSASAVLFGEHAVVIGDGDPVVHPKLSGSDLSLPIFHEFNVKNSLHIWKERIFGTARLMPTAIASGNVSVHTTEVEHFTAVSAWPEFPSTRTKNDSIETGSLPVFVKPLPMGALDQSTILTGVHQSTGIALRWGKSLNRFQILTDRTNMIVCSGFRCLFASIKVALKPFFGDFLRAECAGNYFRAFHVLGFYCSVKSNSNTSCGAFQHQKGLCFS